MWLFWGFRIIIWWAKIRFEREIYRLASVKSYRTFYIGFRIETHGNEVKIEYGIFLK